jgi:hypothetical protein
MFWKPFRHPRSAGTIDGAGATLLAVVKIRTGDPVVDKVSSLR